MREEGGGLIRPPPEAAAPTVRGIATTTCTLLCPHSPIHTLLPSSLSCWWESFRIRNSWPGFRGQVGGGEKKGGE